MNPDSGSSNRSPAERLGRIETALNALRDETRRALERMENAFVVKAEQTATVTRLDRIERELDQRVTMQEFNPVKVIAFGLVGAVLLAFASSITNMFIRPTAAPTTAPATNPVTPSAGTNIPGAASGS